MFLKESNCVFCNIEPDKIILKNELAFVINDKYPHSKGHVLIIPYRHYESYFNSSKEELDAFNDLLYKAKKYTDNKYSPTGYNININDGAAAGQIVMHTHIHLIPRYK